MAPRKLDRTKLPTFKIEREYTPDNGAVIGLDEVGRGPLAGPMMIGGCVFLNIENDEIIQDLGVKDSKKFTSHEKRMVVANKLLEMAAKKKLFYSIKEVSAAEINQAMRKHISLTKVQMDLHDDAALTLKDKLDEIGIVLETVLIDGEITPNDPEVDDMSICVIDGDRQSLSIAAASILAKVHHDEYMIELDKKYPEYGFAKHKGYGTKDHLAAIMEHGVTPEHRIFFGKVKGVKRNPKYF